MDPVAKSLISRRPKNVVIVALANKMARTIWALMAHGRNLIRAGARRWPRQRYNPSGGTANRVEQAGTLMMAEQVGP